MFDLRQDDLLDERTRGLLAFHLKCMHENTPSENVFALDLTGLQASDVTVWSAWQGERIAGIGALKELAEGTAEVKSMRTHPDFLRQGVAQAVLERIIAEATARGMRRLSLETGRGAAFEPALALYRRRGFEAGAPFSTYTENPFSQFFHLEIH